MHKLKFISEAGRNTNMYVYLLRSQSYPRKTYIGCTENLKTRLQAHNAGQCSYSSKFKPWKIVTATWFDCAEKAIAFEKYLKHGSGKAFVNRHFL